MFRCVGRFKGYHPIFTPRKTALARQIIQHCHLQTLHRRVAATTRKVRERFWTPKLRLMVKSARHLCNHYKRYRIKALNPQTTAASPEFRTEFTKPFSAASVDFAGPFLYKSGMSRTRKTLCRPLHVC